MSKLPIRQRLSALTCLKSGQKLVLIEVCELADHGRKPEVDASNNYLATRLGVSERTVSRTLTELAGAGLLLVREAQGKARTMLPAEAVRAVYLAAEPSQAATDNLANLARFNLDKSGKQPRQIRSANLDKSGKQPRQIRSRVIGDDQNDQFNDQHLASEWAGEREALQKKIRQLERENASLRAELLQVVPPVALPPQPAGPPRPQPSGPPAMPPAAELPEPVLAEVKALASEMGRLWKVSEQHGFASWQRLYAFGKHLAHLGQLPELRQQLTGYLAGHMRPGLRPHKLDSWLGDPTHPDGPYRNGVWCGCDWPAVAAEACLRPGQHDASPPGRTAASPTKARQKTDW